METILIITGIVISGCLVYFNSVATIIVFKEPDIGLGLRLVKSLFVWLIPIIGFAFTLRFSQQVFDCDLHYKLLPKLVANWIYDDSLPVANKNRDNNDLKGFCYGLLFYKSIK